jgi:hypothetical protein
VCWNELWAREDKDERLLTGMQYAQHSIKGSYSKFIYIWLPIHTMNKFSQNFILGILMKIQGTIGKFPSAISFKIVSLGTYTTIPSFFPSF